MDWRDQLNSTRKELNEVSPSFCLAKWLQVTLHLQNGFNHSCHHPKTHKTPLKELAANPGALHNTGYKKKQRQMMLKGERPPECAYCWRAEDTPGSHFSDRIIKSADNWARPRLKEVSQLPAKANVNPSYLEVSFGNLCNFRCSYCMPHISSSIWKQYEKFGPYLHQISNEEVKELGLTPIPEDAPNPYVEAFWKWLPDISKDLRVLRVTGGEPLLNPNTFRLFDYFEEIRHPELEFCVNSNLGVPKHLVKKFIDRTNGLTQDQQLKKFILYTSVDTSGRQAEYIRTGLNYSYWLENVKLFLEKTAWPVTIMVTFNLMSVPGFKNFLADVIELNRQFPGKDSSRRVMIDTSLITTPEYFSPGLFDEEWRQRTADLLTYMKQNAYGAVGSFGFSEYEMNKLERIVSWVQSAPLAPADVDRLRGYFYVFTLQYAQREKVGFLEVFPEMAGFYAKCAEQFENVIQGNAER